ncbi:MAG: hypothetical protein FWG82_00430 [Oscillospiraceae bacterium]|nr:hypothetical protein [Oscillospiraceae bacterium]
MPKPLSPEKREEIIFHKKNKETEDEIAKWLRISKSAVTKTWKNYKDATSFESNLNTRGRKPVFGQDILEKIIARIKEKVDITLLELIEEFNLEISESGLSKKLNKIGLNFKKRHFTQKNNNEKMSKNNDENGLNILDT